jgi:hypothetical protein
LTIQAPSRKGFVMVMIWYGVGGGQLIRVNLVPVVKGR